MSNDAAFQEVKDTLFLVLLGPQEEKVLVFSLVRTLAASGNNSGKRFCFALPLAGSQVLGFRFQVDTKATSDSFKNLDYPPLKSFLQSNSGVQSSRKSWIISSFFPYLLRYSIARSVLPFPFTVLPYVNSCFLHFWLSLLIGVSGSII